MTGTLLPLHQQNPRYILAGAHSHATGIATKLQAVKYQRVILQLIQGRGPNKALRWSRTFVRSVKKNCTAVT